MRTSNGSAILIVTDNVSFVVEDRSSCQKRLRPASANQASSYVEPSC